MNSTEKKRKTIVKFNKKHALIFYCFPIASLSCMLDLSVYLRAFGS